MTYPHKIDLPLFEVKYHKNIRPEDHSITLHESHMVWVTKCYMDIHPKDTDDFYTVKEDQYINQIDFLMKDKFVSVESYYENEPEIWILNVYCGDRMNYCNFETESELREVEKVLYSWLLNE